MNCLVHDNYSSYSGFQSIENSVTKRVDTEVDNKTTVYPGVNYLGSDLGESNRDFTLMGT